jgi:5-methylcytosine-specific restriction endonuclease McrA
MSSVKPKSGIRATVTGLKNDLLKQSGGACYYCGEMDEPLTLDHCTPGIESICNYWLACRSCNSRKRDKTVERYRRYLWLQSMKRNANLPDVPWSPIQLEWIASQGFSAEPVTFYIERVTKS